MATQILGTVSLKPRGEYNPSLNYSRLDLVENEGSGYVSLVDSNNYPLIDTTKWMLIASKGDEGPKGPPVSLDVDDGALSYAKGTDIIGSLNKIYTSAANVVRKYTSADAIKGTLKTDGTILSVGTDVNNKTVVVNISGVTHVKVYSRPLRVLYDVSVPDYSMALGRNSSSALVQLLPPSTINDLSYREFDIDVTGYTELTICYDYTYGDDEFYIACYSSAGNELPEVKSYVDSRFEATDRGVIYLAERGFDQRNTAAKNTDIFNTAFVDAKATKSNIVIPPGIFYINTVQIKGGVGFTGHDKNTVLRSGSAVPMFEYTDAEAQSYIELNQLGPSDHCNQGVFIGRFVLAGNGIGTKAMILNKTAYTRFERIYCTGFTDVCFDMKGVLLSDFVDCQFTYTPNGVRITRSADSAFWANMLTFSSCKFRFLTNRAADISRGASISFIRCDLSAVGTNGNASTGGIFASYMSTELGDVNTDILIDSCWGEIIGGAAWFKIETSNGKSVIRNVGLLALSGAATYGIQNIGSKVLVESCTLKGFSSAAIRTESGGQTLLSGFTIDMSTHSEDGSPGVSYKIAQYS